MSKRPLYGLVGKNISHSFSPGFFKKKFLKENIQADYLLFDIDAVDVLPALLKANTNLKGFNVTIPFKRDVMALLQKISPEAQAVGAVNTVKVTNKGLAGFNTDVIGLRESLLPLISEKLPLKALVLGTGGASKAVQYVLNENFIPFQLVGRTKTDDSLTYHEVDQNVLKAFKLIINTTPLGMFPHIDAVPDLPYQYLTKHHILFDLIYNPGETRFLIEGKRVGALTKNGLEMLRLQAEASWKIWCK